MNIRRLKYIHYGSGFVIFSEPMMHNEINVFESGQPISSGTCDLHIVDGKITAECHGHSLSLNLSSKDEDSKLLTLQLNQKWYETHLVSYL